MAAAKWCVMATAAVACTRSARRERERERDRERERERAREREIERESERKRESERERERERKRESEREGEETLRLVALHSMLTRCLPSGCVSKKPVTLREESDFKREESEFLRFRKSAQLECVRLPQRE